MDGGDADYKCRNDTYRCISHIFLPSSQKAEKAVRRSGGEVMHELGSVLMQFFRKRYIWYYIAFIILYRFAEGFVVKNCAYIP